MQTNNKKVSHNILSWKLKYFCLKCPIHQTAQTGTLQKVWISPTSTQGFQYFQYLSGLDLDISRKKNFFIGRSYFLGSCSEKSFAVNLLMYFIYLWYLIYIWVPCFFHYFFSNVLWIDGARVEISRDTHSSSAFVIWNYVHHGQYELINIPFG